MKNLRRSRSIIAMLAAVALPVAAAAPALAKVTQLPAYAFDMVADVTMATTADARCAGITASQKKVQGYIVDLYSRLARDGIGVNDAVAFLGTKPALAELERREKALRQKHGVAAKGDQALCKAIRAEALENKALSGLVQIK